ncbi:unnamed protein product [Periconia digitata]|uniref:Alcohol acetyltransferase n=1 Tax=Periconia digitata TaxID=1303443 RepID=A0A9W4UDG4_9PLEO|nr:unnamed protein product [Periconia digitata]
MEKVPGFLRFASPNEQRTIAREHTGVYHAVIIGATYQFDESFNVHDPSTFYNALHHCIQEHPFLSVAVGDAHTDKSYYRRVTTTTLKDHIAIVEQSANHDDNTTIGQMLQGHLHGTWPEGISPWKIIVLPLQEACFIAFSFSHAIGDGPTGLAFHRSFQRGCSRTLYAARDTRPDTMQNPVTPFPSPFDTPERLPISWGFLLSPFIAQFLPSMVAEWLGMKASVSPVDSGTWLGAKIPSVEEAASAQSMLVVREVEPRVLVNALQQARKHDAKFTGLFIRCIARALSQTVTDVGVTNFVNQTAINMRRAASIPQDEGGMYVSGTYIRYDQPGAHMAFGGDDWKAARNSTKQLAESAVQLQDQAIGLLRYVSSMRKWMLGKFGQTRDCSYEVSNVGVANSNEHDAGTPRQTKFVFAQPGHVLSAPLAFNVASVGGGALVYTVTWQAGALDLGKGSEEEFVTKVCSLLENDLQNLE